MKKLIALLAVVLTLSLLGGLALADGVVNVYNWEDYIAPEVLTKFEEETGVKVNYMRFTTNEDMMVQIRTSEGAFDVVFPSDYCIERLVKEDLLEELDLSKLENSKYVLDWMRNMDFDPDNKHSLPYMWGTVGLLYDTTRVSAPVDSWSVLFDETYKGEVFMMDSIRDTLGITLKYLGYSVNTRDPQELQAATNLLIKQKQDRIDKAYQLDETKDKMVAGEGIIGVVYSGDAEYAQKLNEKLAYVVPKEGSNKWVDGMVIPRTAQNKDNAHLFINFLSRPDIAQINQDYIGYSTPNSAVVEALGEEYSANTTVNPSQETLDTCEFFHDIQDFLPIYNALWAQIKNAK